MSISAVQMTPTQRLIWGDHVARRRRIKKNQFYALVRKTPVKDSKCECCIADPVRWPRPINIFDIVRVVAFEFGAAEDLIFSIGSSGRPRVIDERFVFARQVAMYLSRTIPITGNRYRSLPEIGRKFKRDHTTVIHAVRKMSDLLRTEPWSESAIKIERCRAEILNRQLLLSGVSQAKVC